MKVINADDVLKILHKYGKYIFVTDEKKYSDMVDELSNLKPLEQEPRYCDSNICVSNEYNGIGCDECEVTKSQEPKTGSWIGHQKGRWIYAQCSECGGIHDTVSDYCPSCGCLMDRKDFDAYFKAESEGV